MRSIIPVFGIFLLVGCMPPSPQTPFDDVRGVIGQRTGNTVRWDTRSIDDAAAERAVGSLLATDLSADSAVQIALLNNRNLQATFEDLGIAQADFVQAGLLRNPVFDLSVRFPDRSPSRTYLNLAVAQNFLDIFLVPARRKTAVIQLEAAKARVAHEVLSVSADTKIAFYQYQGAAQILEMRRSIADATAASTDAARRLREAGNITELAYLSERAQDARAHLDLSTAQGQLNEARERLNDRMGLWGTQTSWTAAGRLAELPEIEISAQGLESRAIRQRMDLAAARQQIELQSRALGLTEQTRFFASVDAGAEAEREADGQWRIGPSVSVPLPLFDQGQAAIPRAQSQLRQSRQKYYALAVEIRSQVRMARDRMYNTRAMATFSREQWLPLQQNLLDQMQLQYNGMLVGVFQLLSAKRDQIDAGRQYIESLRDYWVARAELERAIGEDFPHSAPATGPTSTESTQPSTEHQHHHEGHAN